MKAVLRILVTGAAGFIGSHLVEYLVRAKNCDVLGLDNLTYASDLSRLKSVIQDDKFQLEVLDINDTNSVSSLISLYRPDAIIHTAAETSVDRSISKPARFISSNIVGTFSMLCAAREYFESGDCNTPNFRFLYVSTDEVYGSANSNESFTEDAKLLPSSPYAASKAGGDMLAHSWQVTYKLPTLVSNCSNNYGKYQHDEKLLPKMIKKALSGEDIEIYGNGKNERDWLHVSDHVRALWTILTTGQLGMRYNVASGELISNIQAINIMLALVKEIKEDFKTPNFQKQSRIVYVADRLGHDMRYSINSNLIRETLGWFPKVKFEDGIRDLVKWYAYHLANDGA